MSLAVMQIDRRKHFNSDRHGSHFIVVGHQRGGRDIMWKGSIGTENGC